MSLQSLLADFCSDKPLTTQVYSFAGDTFVTLYLPFAPQLDGPMSIDNYYPAYQRVRGYRVELEALLASYTLVEVGYTYKSIALLDGQMMALDSGLLLHPDYGTFFVMEMVRLRGVHAPSPLGLADIPLAMQAALVAFPQNGEAWQQYTALRHSPLCASCGACRAACPMGALSPQNFTRCARYLQWQGVELGSADAVAIGQRMLGCHTCQAVCPYNSGAAYQPPIMVGREVFLAALEGKKGLQCYADCLGNNYLRPAKLLVLGLNCAYNAGDDTYLPYCDRLLAFPDERVVAAARAYLARFSPQN